MKSITKVDSNNIIAISCSSNAQIKILKQKL
jgi:hypothetical protein